jgi:hypothetical protein
MSDVTRYLAAAAHSDGKFRHAVLRDIYYTPFRCKAREFGVDAQFVIDQCLLAEKRRIIRNAILLVVTVIFGLTTSFLSDLRYVLDDPSEINEYIQLNMVTVILLIMVGAGILFGERLLIQHFTLRRQFAKRNQTPSEAIQNGPRQNLIVYGGSVPFVGSGLALRDWSFAVDLRKAKDDDEGDAEAVSVAGVIEAIRKRLADLAIPGLQQYNVLFADGRYIRADKNLMPSSYTLPPSTISEEQLISIDGKQEDRLRTYFCVAITDWSGELVMTSYLRAKKGKSHLFIEVSHFILPPLKSEFYEVDSTDPDLKYKWIIERFFASILVCPLVLILSPFAIFVAGMKPIRR